jgi:hypothetical protein
MIRIEVISPGAFDSEHTSYVTKNLKTPISWSLKVTEEVGGIYAQESRGHHQEGGEQTPSTTQRSKTPNEPL